jgi:hypothetical protein
MTYEEDVRKAVVTWVIFLVIGLGAIYFLM